MKEQYRNLIEQIFGGMGNGIGERLYSILPLWEKKIFVGAVIPVYDKENIRNSDIEAASFLISLPSALKNGAILCGANDSQDEAKHLMEISNNLAEELENARIKSNIAREPLDKITRILVTFDYSKKTKKI